MFSNNWLARSRFSTRPCRSVATTLTGNYIGGFPSPGDLRAWGALL